MSPRRWLAVIASFAAMLGVSAWIIRSEWARDGRPPWLPGWAHLLCLGWVATEVLTRALKIAWGARAIGVPLRLGDALRVCTGGDFAAALTPARSGAEPARFLVLAEAGYGGAPALLVLFVELMVELATLVCAAVVLALTLDGSPLMIRSLTATVGGYATFVITVGVAGYLLSRRNAKGPPPRWAEWLHLHAGRWRAIQRALRNLRASVGALRSARPGWLAGAFLMSCGHVAARLCILPTLVWAVDPAVPLAPLVLWPLVLIWGGAVVPAPGGGGVIEVGFRAAFTGVLLGGLLGGALLWWRFYTYYITIVVGALGAGHLVMRVLRDREPRDAAA